MIYIATAMYYEAEPFIKRLNLKKEPGCRYFNVFRNNEYTLIITGVGKIKSAAAVSFLISEYKVNKRDFLVNVGCCGISDFGIEKGTAFLCNKIVDGASKRAFYPEMIFEHGFREGCVITNDYIQKKDGALKEGYLFDMEASSIFEASTIFLKTHQIGVIKIVSDYIGEVNVDKSSVEDIIYKNLDDILEYTKRVHDALNEYKDVLTSRENEAIRAICESYRMSVTMSNKLIQILRYYKLQNGSIDDLILRMKSNDVHSKNEGKQYIEQLERRIV